MILQVIKPEWLGDVVALPTPSLPPPPTLSHSAHSLSNSSSRTPLVRVRVLIPSYPFTCLRGRLPIEWLRQPARIVRGFGRLSTLSQPRRFHVSTDPPCSRWSVRLGPALCKAWLGRHEPSRTYLPRTFFFARQKELKRPKGRPFFPVFFSPILSKFQDCQRRGGRVVVFGLHDAGGPNQPGAAFTAVSQEYQHHGNVSRILPAPFQPFRT